MADDREFEPRLGCIRSGGAGRARTYLQRVLRAAALAGSGRNKGPGFEGSRIGRGFGAGRVLASRDRLAAFRTRRVIIKTRVVRLRGASMKAAALHLRYIQRDGVTRDGEPGELYSRETDHADGTAFLNRSGEDRHQFRFIVSAEDAGEYGDLKPFVRKLMARIESDLGTGLDWVAVDHHNTGHPHTHIVWRGRDDLGQDLVIARDYIAHGMRERAAEIVTLDFGPRSDLEVEDRFARQVAQERFTDLDRLLRRAAAPDGALSVADCKNAVAHHHWTGRLQVLARLGLAEEETPGHWRLAADLETTLKAMGERADIIKTMHRELAAHAMDRDVAALSVLDQSGKVVTGRVLARGLSDERDGLHYLVVDGVDGRVHYATVSEDADGAMAAGAIVRLGNELGKTRTVDRVVEAIAARHGGRYSAALHRAHDPKASPEFITAHIRRLEAMRRRAGLVERHADGSWSIALDHAARGSQFDRNGGSTQIELLSPTPLDQLAQMRARTWLDRELIAEQKVPLHDAGFGLEVADALSRRRQWLLQEGLARAEERRTLYPSDLLIRLRDQELARAGATLADELRKSYAPLANGPIEGTYRGPLQLVSGKFAIIEKARDFTLVPWRPALERKLGKRGQGIVRGDFTSWTVGRQRGPTIS